MSRASKFKLEDKLPFSPRAIVINLHSKWFCLFLICFPPLRIGNPQAIHPHTHQHAMFNPAPLRLPHRSSLSDPYSFRPSHGSEPVTARPPHTFRPATTGSKPAAACHDHSPAHHGYVYHHGNHLVAGHG